MLNNTEDAIETLIAEGAALDWIEEHINNLPLDEEQQSALWLLAWLKSTSAAACNTLTTDKLAHLR
jgi:hypothetical protein